MSELTKKQQNELDNLLDRYADQLSDANMAYFSAINHTELLSESGNSPVLKNKIVDYREQYNQHQSEASQTKQYIATQFPNANFTIATERERTLRSEKEAALKATALKQLKAVVLEAIQIDVKKIELKQSFEAQQDNRTATTLFEIKNERVPKLKQDMQASLLAMRGAGYSKLEVSDITREAIKDTYVTLTKDAIITAEKARQSDDPHVIAAANEKIGFIGGSAITKHLNPTTILHQAHEQANQDKTRAVSELIEKTKAVAETTVDSGFASELMSLKRELSENGLSLADAVSQLPEESQTSFRRNNQKLQHEQEGTLAP